MVLLDVIRLEFKVHGPFLAMVFYAAFSLAWLYFLLRGVRWIWIGTVALFVLGLAYDLVAASILTWATVLGLIELVLLLLPATRLYFSKKATSVVVDPG